MQLFYLVRPALLKSFARIATSVRRVFSAAKRKLNKEENAQEYNALKTTNGKLP
jgi:hypothetical protein